MVIGIFDGTTKKNHKGLNPEKWNQPLFITGKYPYSE